MWRVIACSVAVLCCGSAALAGRTFRDDFASYAEAGSGEPAWDTDSVLWEMRGGGLECANPGRSFAVYAAPYADEQIIEATLEVSGTTTDQWKIAGVAIFSDPANYWHLALVESPDTDGARHYVELVEAYRGRWLAEAAPDTKLTLVERTGGDFDWRYDRPYRLRLRLTPHQIGGTVSELEGEVVTRIAYRLDNPRSVRAGRAGLDSGGFRSRFDDFHLEVTGADAPPKQPALPPAEVRSWPGLRGPASGFFRVEQRDGTWWMFDPQGRAFYVIRTDHANYDVHRCEALGYAPYHRNVAEKYGGEEAWAGSTAARLKSWGFNTVAANYSPSLRYRGLAHIDLLGLGQSFASFDDIAPQVHWTGFPNVFSPKWKEHCRKQARQRCLPAQDDPWLVGYFFDNELEWYGKSGQPWGLADDAFKKPAEHTAKRALVDFLRRRYRGDIAAFNRAWETDVASFDALLTMEEPLAEKVEAARSDKQAFVRLIAGPAAACRALFLCLRRGHLRGRSEPLLLGCRAGGGLPRRAQRGPGGG